MKPGGNYSYRIPLLASEVEHLFCGTSPDTLEGFKEASQIAQAEAKKYFIEMFRVKKWNRTGMIWWNLIDGWPQFSDAIVDYYLGKKKAYEYIKRAQQPLCLMFDEPKDGAIMLYAVNDRRGDARINYKVTDVTSGRVVLAGDALAPQDAAAPIASHPIEAGEKHFYLIEWTDETGAASMNHYMTGLREGVDFAAYTEAAKVLG